MRVDLGQWTPAAGWRFHSANAKHAAAQLVLYFASPAVLDDLRWWQDLRKLFPAAKLVGCSTGGEILGSDVSDGTVAAAVVQFAHSAIDLRCVGMDSCGSSGEAGRRLGAQLPPAGLRAVFVLSDGTQVNGSDLVRGLKETLAPGVTLTGGLAGDGAAFHTTAVGADCPPAHGVILALGFYGECLSVGHGSFGGWDAFGPERRITRSTGNILYELDGEPALDLYTRYLGEEAANLPGSALLYPLRVRGLGSDAAEVVRTVVGIDEKDRAMIFAGDVPQGCSAQLMHGDFDHLIDGAGAAAQQASAARSGSLAILVSCIGRKLLMGQRITEEVEAVADILGSGCATLGFYSYGEISPQSSSGSCELHNQTMTITLLDEVDRA